MDINTYKQVVLDQQKEKNEIRLSDLIPKNQNLGHFGFLSKNRFFLIK
ncbi:MAG: hypothetical protein FWH18_12925 [Marinilabiliaceae bacterium]|nr:hypothetical protein [Marinilabiliaceae bacterium]